jgi:hypothetical protein
MSDFPERSSIQDAENPSNSQGQCQERHGKGWEEAELLQQYSDVNDCEAQEILGQSSLSATKAPQYERVINGLGMMSPGALAGCGTTISAQQNFDGPRVWQKPGLSGLSDSSG